MKNRWPWRALFGFLLLALVANFLVRRLSFESFQSQLAGRLSTALGVDVDIANEVHLELLPRIRMEVEGLTVANPPGRGDANFLEVQRVAFDVKFLPLFRGMVVVNAVDVGDADLNLETDSEGHFLLLPGLETGPEGRDWNAETGSFRIERVGLKDIHISYRAAGEEPVKLELEHLRLEAEASDHSIRANGDGSIEGRPFEFDADTGKADSLFEPTAGFPVDLTLRIGEASSAEGIRANLKGSILDVARFAGVDLAVDVDGDVFSFANRFVDASFPPVPLKAEFRLSDADGSLGADGISAEMSHSDAFRGTLQGDLGDLRNADGVDVKIDFSVRDLAETAALFGAEWPAIGPIQGNGRIQGKNERLVSNGTARVGETSLSGDLNATFGKGIRPRIDAVLESSHVRLEDFGLAQAVEPDGEGPKSLSLLLERWWSKEKPIRVEWLREVDLDMTLRFALLSGRGGFELKPIGGEVDLEDGVLSIHQIRGSYDEGLVDGALRVDAREERALWHLQLEAFNVNLTRTVEQFSSEVKKEGKYVGRFDVSADLTSVGSTRREMTASLAGRVGVMLREGDLISGYAQEFFHDYLRFAVPGFLTLRGSRKGPAVHCLLGVAPITKGVADLEQFFLEGDRISVAGTGSIDLVNDELNLRFAPRVHDPGLVSVTATVDVTGPIESPKFTPLATSVAKNVGRALFKNALRPITGTLGAGLRSAAKPVEDPCAAAVVERIRKRKAG